jgi:hypothetical protein
MYLTGEMNKDLDKLMHDTREADSKLFEKIKSMMLSVFPLLDFDAFEKGEQLNDYALNWFHRLLEALNKPLACSLFDQPFVPNLLDGDIICEIFLNKDNFEPVIMKLASLIGIAP